MSSQASVHHKGHTLPAGVEIVIQRSDGCPDIGTWFGQPDTEEGLS
jgi:hypothetical protein